MYNMITCKSRDCDWDYCTHIHIHNAVGPLPPSFHTPLSCFFLLFNIFCFRFQRLSNKLKNSCYFDISFLSVSHFISFSFAMLCLSLFFSHGIVRVFPCFLLILCIFVRVIKTFFVALASFRLISDYNNAKFQSVQFLFLFGNFIGIPIGILHSFSIIHGLCWLWNVKRTMCLRVFVY